MLNPRACALFLACELTLTSVLALPLVKREETSGDGEVSFQYQGNTGPNLWPGFCQDINPGQSPIDIRPGSADPNDGSLQADLQQMSGVKLRDSGHGLEFVLPEGGGGAESSFVAAAGGGEAFRINGFHIHCPSEHRYAGKYFDAEVHFVGESPSGKSSVMSVMFEVSDQPIENNLMSMVAQQLPLNGKTVDLPTFDLSSIQTATNNLTGFHTYVGSLTTPPCTGGVLWNVLDTPVPISVKEMLAVRQEQGFSARYVQVARDERALFNDPVQPAPGLPAAPPELQLEAASGAAEATQTAQPVAAEGAGAGGWWPGGSDGSPAAVYACGDGSADCTESETTSAESSAALEWTAGAGDGYWAQGGDASCGSCSSSDKSDATFVPSAPAPAPDEGAGQTAEEDYGAAYTLPAAYAASDGGHASGDGSAESALTGDGSAPDPESATLVPSAPAPDEVAEQIPEEEQGVAEPIVAADAASADGDANGDGTSPEPGSGDEAAPPVGDDGQPPEADPEADPESAGGEGGADADSASGEEAGVADADSTAGEEAGDDTALSETPDATDGTPAGLGAAVASTAGDATATLESPTAPAADATAASPVPADPAASPPLVTLPVETAWYPSLPEYAAAAAPAATGAEALQAPGEAAAAPPADAAAGDPAAAPPDVAALTFAPAAPAVADPAAADLVAAPAPPAATLQADPGTGDDSHSH